MALQCPEHAHYHVQSEGVYVEVVDDRQLRHHCLHDDSLRTELLMLDHDEPAWWWGALTSGVVQHEKVDAAVPAAPWRTG